VQIEPSGFRARYQNLLDVKKQRFVIKTDSGDPWGIVITTRGMTWVQVWHNLQKQTLTLGLWGEGRDYIGDASPSNAQLEDTGKFKMFRWSVPFVDITKPPHEQPDFAEILEKVKSAFDWVRQCRAARPDPKLSLIQETPQLP
jgi:hypothetical protein